MVQREIATCQIAQTIGLVVLAVVRLRTVADIGGISIVEAIVEASVVAILKKRRRDNRTGLRSEIGHQAQLAEGIRVFRLAGVLPLPFKCKEAEHLVLDKWSSNGPTEKLPAVGRLFPASLLGLRVNSIEGFVAEKSKRRSVIAVGPGLCDHVDGSSFRAAIRS